MVGKMFGKRSLQGFAVLFAVACTSPYSRAQQQPAVALNAYFDSLQHSGAFNGNILVAERGKVILERAIGNADASGKLKLTFADRFLIGSISKEFDSVGLLMLQQQGKLALSDPLSRFFPELPSWASTITVNQLLHYTSGLHKPDFSKVHSDAENWAAIKALPQLDFVPGTQYSYNNNDVLCGKESSKK